MKRIWALHASLYTAGFALALGSACSTGTGNAGGSGGGVGGSNPGVTSATSSTNATATGSTGTTSSSSTGGPPTTGVCAGAGTRVLTATQPDAFIDDFEEATGISPGWSTFNDITSAPNSVKLLQVSGGAANTAHGGLYSGTGATTAANGGYGVGAVYNTAIDPSAMIYCVDISVFTGVSFWAKAGTAGSMISLNYVLPTTNMVSMNDAGTNTGGDCTANCYNHPRVTFSLTTEWAQYTAPFASANGGSATVQSVIQEIAFLSPDANWDFSIDEIAFYTGTTAPTGPVGPNPNGGSGTGAGGSTGTGGSGG